MGCLVQERTLNEKRTMSACRCQRFTLKYPTVTLSLLCSHTDWHASSRRQDKQCPFAKLDPVV
ncbi:hypothetical protein T01_127 [Trichinella spiralis]|uniref:Uncharacterized protein n=1 Tax=Trichinella spiralis TaxID=6334 RepID=A0A0V1B892_TRISP|nr:hypothetical protein T01_127 [Trichinella spiralis]